MKKILLVFCMALMSTSLFAQVGTSYVGVNANYCLKSHFKPFGVGVKFQHEFFENVRGEASFNYFFKKSTSTVTTSYTFPTASPSIRWLVSVM